MNPGAAEKSMVLRVLLWLMVIPLLAYWRGREAAYRRVNDYNRGVLDAWGGRRRGLNSKG
ncbi:MAG TPA: hypothetical protein VFI17_03450 [Solirubrobacterales bacterium]|nr:hypothetical protein [Solirubrobacterales bacterium]